jgi:chromosome transmission fidelity protein 18
LLKKVNEQLITPPERLALFRVVDAMLKTGLKYSQYKVDDGSFVFKLEPHGIENLISFGPDPKVIRGRYAVRQLVSREMGREKIRRRRGGNISIISIDLDLVDIVEPRGVKRASEPNEKSEKKIVERVRKDFFGRVLAEEVNDGKRRRTDSSNGLKIQSPVWVRYHEGYSNAVRKPVVFLELLGAV